MEKTMHLRKSSPEGIGLTARAIQLLQYSLSKESPDPPPAGDPAEIPAPDPVAGLIAAAPGTSVILAYNISGLADPDLFEATARRIVAGNGEVKRYGCSILYVILYHMESADPDIILELFGLALGRMSEGLQTPPDGHACIVNP